MKEKVEVINVELPLLGYVEDIFGTWRAVQFIETTSNPEIPIYVCHDVYEVHPDFIEYQMVSTLTSRQFVEA